MTTSKGRLSRIAAPQPGNNLFPLCACERVCLVCAAGCVAQCVERDGPIQCQQLIHHDGPHFAEGRTDDGRWFRMTWAEVGTV